MKPGAYLLSVLILAMGIGSAQAKDPVALIENMAAGIDGPKNLELLYPDQVIDLKTDGWIEIGYHGSCVHERITGGKVRIGTDRSHVEGGQVVRDRVECDGGRLVFAGAWTGALTAENKVRIRRSEPSGPDGAARELRGRRGKPFVTACC